MYALVFEIIVEGSSQDKTTLSQRVLNLLNSCTLFILTLLGSEIVCEAGRSARMRRGMVGVKVIFGDAPVRSYVRGMTPITKAIHTRT